MFSGSKDLRSLILSVPSLINFLQSWPTRQQLSCCSWSRTCRQRVSGSSSCYSSRGRWGVVSHIYGGWRARQAAVLWTLTSRAGWEKPEVQPSDLYVKISSIFITNGDFVQCTRWVLFHWQFLALFLARAAVSLTTLVTNNLLTNSDFYLVSAILDENFLQKHWRLK